MLVLVILIWSSFGIRIKLSPTKTQGFIRYGVCGQCAPLDEGVNPNNVENPIYDEEGSMLAQNWTSFKHILNNQSKWNVDVWIGGKFNCDGWLSKTHCGGGIVLFTNGSRYSEPCNSWYNALCVCDDGEVNFAIGLDTLCEIKEKHDIYCAFGTLPPTMMSYSNMPPSKEIYASSYTIITRYLNNTYAAWGAYATPSLPPPPDGSEIAEITMTFYTIVIRTHKGGIYCMGENAFGTMFGDGGEYVGIDIEQWHAVPVPPASKLVSGYISSCIIAQNDSSVWCWGANDYGERGEAAHTDIYHPFPSPTIPLPFAVTDICGNGFHYCVTGWDDNGIWCWGSSTYGENGIIFQAAYPVRAVLFDNVYGQAKELTCGGFFTCLQLKNNSYACVGQYLYSVVGADRITGYAQIMPNFEGIKGLTRKSYNFVCGTSYTNNTLLCNGMIDSTPKVSILSKLKSGTLCASHDTYSPFVCGILDEQGGKLVCVGGSERANQNFVALEDIHNVTRIFCNSFYVTIELDTGDLYTFSLLENRTLVEMSNFTLSQPVRSIVKHPGMISLIYLCENNEIYTGIYDDYDSSYTIYPPSWVSNFVQPDHYLHLSSYMSYVCSVNTSHPRIVSVREAPSLEKQEYHLTSNISVLRCGPAGTVAWIYSDGGEIVVQPSNPFNITSGAIDIVINSVHICALNTDGIITCYQRDADTWIEIPTSSQLSLPGLTHAVAGYGFICAEELDGDSWCMHPYPDYIEGSGPIGSNPLRLFFGNE